MKLSSCDSILKSPTTDTYKTNSNQRVYNLPLGLIHNFVFVDAIPVPRYYNQTYISTKMDIGMLEYQMTS